MLRVLLDKFITECTYVHVWSYLRTISLIKHAFVYDSHLKLLDQPKWCGALCYNRENAHIFVLGEKEMELKIVIKIN